VSNGANVSQSHGYAKLIEMVQYIFVSYRKELLLLLIQIMTVIGYLLHDWLPVEHVYILHHHFQDYEVDLHRK